MNDRLTPNLIALLTDFGTKDYFVGAVKGAILSINSDAKIVDLTHRIEPQNVSAASFTLRACYKNFPAKTIFVAVVDPGVGSSRKAILVETDDYFFIAPDNGLLSFIPDKTEDIKVYELTNEKFFAATISATFHGRDVFAPVAAHLSNGVQAKEFGGRLKSFVRLSETKPSEISPGKIVGAIIYIDRFGNLVTNFSKENLAEKFVLEINNQKIEKLLNYFAEAEKDELVMIFGSAGFLEICAVQGSARKRLAVEVGQKITAVNL